MKRRTTTQLLQLHHIFRLLITFPPLPEPFAAVQDITHLVSCILECQSVHRASWLYVGMLSPAIEQAKYQDGKPMWEMEDGFRRGKGMYFWSARTTMAACYSLVPLQ